eukprot:COSAG06_NODE_13_length_35352_cov_49.626255_42_plen_33_part_00
MMKGHGWLSGKQILVLLTATGSIDRLDDDRIE